MKWTKNGIQCHLFNKRLLSACLPPGLIKSVTVIFRNEGNKAQRNALTCWRKSTIQSHSFFQDFARAPPSVWSSLSLGLHVGGCFHLAGFSSLVTSSWRPSLITLFKVTSSSLCHVILLYFLFNFSLWNDLILSIYLSFIVPKIEYNLHSSRVFQFCSQSPALDPGLALRTCPISAYWMNKLGVMILKPNMSEREFCIPRC